MENQIQTTTKAETIPDFLTNTFEDYVTKFSPKVVKRGLHGVKTIKDSLEAKTPTIGASIRKHGERKIETFVKIWIADFLQSVNLKRSLNEDQVDEIAFLVVSEYRNMTISDINLIFKNAKLGKYGQFYESIDVVKVLGWFNEYFENRIRTAEDINHTRHKQNKFTGIRVSTAREDNAKSFKELQEYNLKNRLK